MKYGNLTLGQVEALVNKLGGMDVVNNILRENVKFLVNIVSVISQTFTVRVDETKTIEELTKNGNFDWNIERINSHNFPKPKDGVESEKEISLFHFNKTMISEEVISEMNKISYRPATIWELFGLITAHPNLQRKFPMTSLGSVCVLNGSRCVASFHNHTVSCNHLSLDWFNIIWNHDRRFAGVRK